MKELLWIPVFTVTIYLLYVYLKYGMTISISATYKHVKGWERPWFSVTLCSIAIPVMIVGIEAVPVNKSEVLFFLAGSLLCLVGASPKFWSGKMELTAHLVGSYGSIGLGMIASLVYFFNAPTIFYVGIYGLFVLSQFFVSWMRLNNYIYWVEVGAIITIITILLIN